MRIGTKMNVNHPLRQNRRKINNTQNGFKDQANTAKLLSIKTNRQ